MTPASSARTIWATSISTCPRVHGFDEFFGYLYHLDAMSDPYWFDYPQDWIDKTGPRDLVHCWATTPTIQPYAALGQGRQTEDRG